MDPRTVDIVQRNLDAVRAVLRKRDERDDKPLEEIAAELLKKRAALDKVKTDIDELWSLNQVPAEIPSRYKVLTKAALTAALTGSARGDQNSCGEVAPIPSLHRGPVQVVLWISPIEPRILWESPLQSRRGDAGVQGKLLAAACLR